MSLGVPVSPVTIVVQKRRWSRIGIQLNGGITEPPTVVGSADPRFEVNDLVYIVNGKYVMGAKTTARIIRRKRFLSITILRERKVLRTLVEDAAALLPLS